MRINRIKTALLVTMAAFMTVSSVFAQEAPVKFSKVLLEDQFDGYEKDTALPQRGAWSYTEPGGDSGVTVREDSNEIFADGGSNRYLELRDNSAGGPVRLIAQDIPGLNATLVRVSFDAYRAKGGLNGAVAITTGRRDVDAVNPQDISGLMQIGEAGRLMPAVTAGGHRDGMVFHVDAYYNATDEKVEYMTADGGTGIVRPGLMDVWINGRLRGNGKLENVPSPITSLRIETYTAPVAEIWIDNLEVAVPQD